MANTEKKSVFADLRKGLILCLVPFMMFTGCSKKGDDTAEGQDPANDTKAPKIECKDTTLIEGNALDMDKLVTITDEDENVKFSYKCEPAIEDTKKLEVGEYTITVTAIDSAQNVSTASFKLNVKVDEVAAAKRAEEEKKKAEEEAKKKAEEEEAQRKAEEEAAAEAAAQQPVYTEPQPSYDPGPTYQCWDGSYAYSADGCPAAPAPSPSPSQSHGTQYFMFSDGYDFNSGYNACVAAGSAYGTYSCQPIQGADGIYTGYMLTY